MVRPLLRRGDFLLRCSEGYGFGMGVVGVVVVVRPLEGGHDSGWGAKSELGRTLIWTPKKCKIPSDNKKIAPGQMGRGERAKKQVGRQNKTLRISTPNKNSIPPNY